MISFFTSSFGFSSSFDIDSYGDLISSSLLIIVDVGFSSSLLTLIVVSDGCSNSFVLDASSIIGLVSSFSSFLLYINLVGFFSSICFSSFGFSSSFSFGFSFSYDIFLYIFFCLFLLF
jgi:hypothetical protein